MSKEKTVQVVRAIEGHNNRIPNEYRKHKLRVTEVPAGHCPIPLQGMLLCGDFPSYAEIVEWFHRVRDWGIENGVFYTSYAIAYWARTDYDELSYEYNEIQNVIIEYAEMRGEHDHRAWDTREKRGGA